MFRFSHGGGHRPHHGGPRGRGPEFDPERFLHWVERLNAGERGRGHGRSRRMFDGGELRLVLLKLIADEPRHGYDLIRAIEAMTGGAYAPSPGVVYPTLTLLDEMGLIEEQASEGAKKRFAATESGRAELKEKAEEVAELIARLTAVGEERRSSPHRQLHRAMENVRNALRHQRAQGMSPERVEAIVDLLDEVAKKIERLG
ncbi:PadR family transcriptional regulator [Sphingomonas sp. ASV193]|uniref:PadR family transcriptional regulator n=1 Tax=Sphingomonas sp. ASV193 TaxID=3144405 RepID=UPI0032E920E6